MDSAELDNALAELETRVERLRALYEQYFLGIERLEPAVPRKDVDRRIWQLRREKIRNTAKRFKLQTIIQRYNTLQMYWQRICREIDRGTYRRHVLRAERATTTVSDIVAQKEAERRAHAEARTTADDLADMLARDVDAEQEFARAVAEASGHLDGSAKSTPPPPRRSTEALDLELDDIPSTHPPPAARVASATRAEPRGNLLAALGSRPGTGRGNVSSLVGPTPVRQGRLRRTAAEAGPAVPAPAPAAPAPAAPAAPALAAPMRTPTAQPDRRPGPAPQPAPQNTANAAPRPAVARPAEAAKPAGNPAPRPAGSSAAAAPAAVTATQPKPAPAQSLTDQRILELHRELVATKQRIKEAGKVSVDGLAKSLRAAESKLQAQHKDRRIDFDIVIKNGKAVVKPIVR